MRKVLKNKPLVEAIFELHWELQGKAPSGEKIDPDHRRFLARMEEDVIKNYPKYRLLPAADIPERLVPYVVQHQFWTAENTWPVIQVGPGIVTLNDTAGYDWLDFKDRISYLVKLLFEVHPGSSDFRFRRILLRYINAVEFDYDKTNITTFLNDKMGVVVDTAQIMPQDSRVATTPYSLNLTSVFRSQQPKGIMELNIKHGKRQGNDALLWQLTNYAIDDDVPGPTQEGIVAWAEEAHSLIYDLFSNLIAGDLLKEFE